MTADEKLKQIREQLERVAPAEPMVDDFVTELLEIIDGPEDGEQGRVDVSGAIPGPMMAVFAMGLEIASVEHEQLGLLLELTFELPAAGHCKVIVADATAELVATAIIDGSRAGRQAQEQGRVEKVTGKLWLPGE